MEAPIFFQYGKEKKQAYKKHSNNSNNKFMHFTPVNKKSLKHLSYARKETHRIFHIQVLYILAN